MVSKQHSYASISPLRVSKVVYGCARVVPDLPRVWLLFPLDNAQHHATMDMVVRERVDPPPLLVPLVRHVVVSQLQTAASLGPQFQLHILSHNNNWNHSKVSSTSHLELGSLREPHSLVQDIHHLYFRLSYRVAVQQLARVPRPVCGLRLDFYFL